MQRRYEVEIAKGRLPIADPGLDFYNQIIAEQFDEIEDETNRALEHRRLTHGFTILNQESEQPIPRRIEILTVKQKNYFLETDINVYGAPEFILYDKDYKPLIKADDINKILDFF